MASCLGNEIRFDHAGFGDVDADDGEGKGEDEGGADAGGGAGVVDIRSSVEWRYIYAASRKQSATMRRRDRLASDMPLGMI